MVGLLISALGGYTIEQSKPDTRQGTNPQPRPADGVRARSCVSRAPDAVCVVGGSPWSARLPTRCSAGATGRCQCHEIPRSNCWQDACL